MVRVQVPATTANMGPGFDTLGMALQLYNIIEIEEIAGKLVIEIEGAGAERIPRNEKNVVYQAANMLFQKAKYIPRGLRLKLINNVPIASGLGSSATAIVGGLMAANVIAGKPFGEKELLNMATTIEGHPDNVAPALLGGIIVSALCDGDVKFIKIKPPKEMKCVVATPDFPLSTRKAREVLPQNVSLTDAVFNISRVSMLVAALMQGDLNMLGIGMDDKIHQPYRSSLVPGMKKVFAAVKLAGAKGVALSGAGPTLIAFCDRDTKLIAKVMKDTFIESGIQAKVLELEPNPIGARVFEVKK